MLIPSKYLLSALSGTSFGLFWDHVAPNDKIVLAPKVSSELIKSIVLGAKVFISTALLPISRGFALCSTLSIEDDPAAMFYLRRTHNSSDTEMLSKFYKQENIELHPFDELNRNVASFNCKFSTPHPMIDDFLKIGPMIPMLSSEEAFHVLVHLEKVINENTAVLKQIELIVVEEMSPSPIFYHIDGSLNSPIYEPNRFKSPYHIRDGNQGKQLEINLARLLTSIFNKEDIFPSPFAATSGTRSREFTDLVAVCDSGLLLIEAKARAITLQTTSQDTERRIKNIVKQVDKGLRQLHGAYREAVKEGVISLKGQYGKKEVAISNLTVHLVVLVSENHPDLAKTDIPKKVLDLGEDLGIGVHIFDLTYLSKILRQCDNNRELMLLLNRRWELSCSHRIIKFADEFIG